MELYAFFLFTYILNHSYMAPEPTTIQQVLSARWFASGVSPDEGIYWMPQAYHYQTRHIEGQNIVFIKAANIYDYQNFIKEENFTMKLSMISNIDLFKTQPTHGEANGFDRRPAYVLKIINNYTRGDIIRTPYLPYDLKFILYSGTYQEREFDAFNDTLYFGLLVETPKELSEYGEFSYMWLPWQWFVKQTATDGFKMLE